MTKIKIVDEKMRQQFIMETQIILELPEITDHLWEKKLLVSFYFGPCCSSLYTVNSLVISTQAKQDIRWQELHSYTVIYSPEPNTAHCK